MSVQTDRSAAWTEFSVDSDVGCEENPDTFETLCGQIEVTIRRGGRQVGDLLMDEADGLGFLDNTYFNWKRCSQAGRYRWSALLVNFSGDEIDRASGVFRIPRCHSPRSRTVPYGTAARGAEELAPDDEIVSDIVCEGHGHRLGSRHSRWYCGVRSNNTWRWCDRFFRLDYVLAPTDSDYGEPGWGRMERTYFWTRFHAPECHRF